MNPKLVVESIDKKFKVSGLLRTETNNPTLSLHVNSLVCIGLAELDMELSANKLAQNINKFRHRSSFFKSLDINKDSYSNVINTCKTALACLALIAVGRKIEAERTIKELFSSPLFDAKMGLFMREYEDKRINPLIITQSNLWLALALFKCGKIKQAKKLLEHLDKISFDNIKNLYVSSDCESDSSHGTKVYYSDDQALGIIVNLANGNTLKAELLLKGTMSNGLYDTESGLFFRNIDALGINKEKTSYKNGLWGIALGMLNENALLLKLQKGLTRFQDKNDKLFYFSDLRKQKIPDNSMLALMALNYSNLKHKIF